MGKTRSQSTTQGVTLDAGALMELASHRDVTRVAPGRCCYFTPPPNAGAVQFPRDPLDSTARIPSRRS